MNKRLRKYLSAFLSAAVTSGMVGSSNVLAEWKVGQNLQGINLGEGVDYEQKLAWQNADTDTDSDKSLFSKALRNFSVTEIMNVNNIKTNSGAAGDIVKDAVLSREKVSKLALNSTTIENLKPQLNALKGLQMGPDGSLLKYDPDNDLLCYVVVKKADVLTNMGELKLDSCASWKYLPNLSYNTVSSAIGEGENVNNWCALCVGDPSWVKFTDENEKTAKAGETLPIVTVNMPGSLKTNVIDWHNDATANAATKLSGIVTALGGLQIGLLRYGTKKTELANFDVDNSTTPLLLTVNVSGQFVGFQLKYADVTKYLNNEAVHITKSFAEGSGSLNSVFNVSVDEGGLGDDDITTSDISELIKSTPGARSYALANLTSGTGAQPKDRLQYKGKDAVLAYEKSTGNVYVTSFDGSNMNSPQKVGELEKGFTLAQFSMILSACYGIDLDHVYVSDYAAMMLIKGTWQYNQDKDLLRFPSGKYLAHGDNPGSDPGIAFYKLSFLLQKGGGTKLADLITPEALQTIKTSLQGDRILTVKKMLLSRGLPDAAKIMAYSGVILATYLLFDNFDNLLSAYSSYADDTGVGQPGTDVDQLGEGETYNEEFY